MPRKFKRSSSGPAPLVALHTGLFGDEDSEEVRNDPWLIVFQRGDDDVLKLAPGMRLRWKSARWQVVKVVSFVPTNEWDECADPEGEAETNGAIVDVDVRDGEPTSIAISESELRHGITMRDFARRMWTERTRR